MLQGPWKEANAPVLNLNVDDKNVNGEAMEIALAYLYGHYPKLNDSNTFRVLAAASFLDLQVTNGNRNCKPQPKLRTPNNLAEFRMINICSCPNITSGSNYYYSKYF